MNDDKINNRLNAYKWTQMSIVILKSAGQIQHRIL